MRKLSLKLKVDAVEAWELKNAISSYLDTGHEGANALTNVFKSVTEHCNKVLGNEEDSDEE